MNGNEKEDEISVIREEHEPNEFQQEDPSSTVIDAETSFLTPEQIEEFFKATEDGSVERLEQLFDEKLNADPNMTHFTESLLMAAIRTNQNEVADYLIDQLAVNVQYASDLHEFRSRRQNPVRHRRVSCRDLAYENGMMELVDLIDITSDDVTPNIKRYLKIRLQKRLSIIHQAYLKRLEEHNKRLLFQTNEENENTEPPAVDIIDENIVPSSSMLPPVTHRVYKSHIEQTIQSIDTPKNKSIDETGKKTFRFSNYTLRFRLIETPDINNKSTEQFQFKTTIPSLPNIPLYAPPSTSLITTNNIHHSISQTSSRLPTRDARASVYRSPKRTTLPTIAPPENKSPITTITKRPLRKRVNQNNIKYTYIPQEQNALYNQPRCFMPVTLQSTAIGLPSKTRIIRD